MSSSVLFDAPGPQARRRHALLGGVGALVAAALTGLVLWRLGEQGQLDGAKWSPMAGSELWRSYLLPGLLGTLKAAGISIVLAAVLGALMALGRMSSLGPLRWVCGVLVELLRAIPVLVMMIFTFALYVRYGVFADDVNPLAGVVTALTLYNGAVIAEVIRSGVAQLPKGQREAGLSLGLSDAQTLRTVLLPQAVTAMMPTLVSQLVVVLKDTALGYNITYAELLYSGNDAATNYTNLVPLLIVVAAIYILINYLVTRLAELLERRLQRRGRPVAGPDPVPGGPAGPAVEVGTGR